MKTKEYEVGTLSDSNELTCCAVVAKSIKHIKKIEKYNTFESAIEDLKVGEISRVLVPCAYPKIGKFIMDSEVESDMVFNHEIPSLVLAGFDCFLPKEIKSIILHPATVHLLQEVDVNYDNLQYADSNTEACKIHLKTPSKSIVITNENSARFYNLNIYKVIRIRINMPFIIFKKKQ